MELARPLIDPVWIMAVATAAFLVAPFVARWTRLPSIVVLILAGAAIGPAGAGLLARDPTIVLLGTVGLLYLMLVAGLELDLQGFARHRGRSLAYGALSFALPALLALVAAPLAGFGLAATLLVVAVVSSHTLLAYPVAQRLGLSRDPAVTAVVGGTLVTDTLSLAVLAVAAALATGEVGPAFLAQLAGSLALYGAVVVLALPRVARWFFRNTDAEATGRFVFLLAAMFLSAAFAQGAGAAPIIGAFLAGLTLNRFVPHASVVMTRVRFFGDALLVPFFLLSVGMLVDVRVLASLETLGLALLFVAVVFLGKGGAGLLAGRLLGFGRVQGRLMAGLSLPQAAATLAVTFVGLELGLFGPAVVNAVVALVLVSSLVGAALVERAGRALVLARPADGGDASAPHRILVPVANPATAERLLDVAFLVRDPASDEAVYPISVVRDEGDVEARVAAAERVLAHAVVYAAEADVPVVPLTRVALNPAAGIVQSAREQRITDVILGWRGASSAQRATFGGIIDQVVDRGEAQVLVCRLDHPIATTRRAFLLLPPAVDHNPGFFAAAATLKRLLGGLGAPATALTVETDAQRLQRRFADVPGDLDVAFESAVGWSAVARALQERAKPEDLVVMVGARPGTAAWSPALDRLPGLLARLGTSFVAVLPSEAELDATPAEVARRGGVAALLAPERVRLDLVGDDLAAAVAPLLSELFEPGSRAHRQVLRALVEDEVGFAAEHLPGVAVLHARHRGVAAPALALGVHRAGLRHPQGRGRVHVFAVLVSPVDGPAQPHLARLANVVQRLHEVGAGPLREAPEAAAVVALLARPVRQPSTRA
jgi:Kef-type K+ transport system membrane component KefB